jgi:hypothetical protein
VAFVGIGGVSVQLGKQLDDDDLSISDGSVDLALGCFDILVSLASNKSIVPLAVAKLGNQVYTVNDYAESPPVVILDDTGVPSAGTLTMTSRDNSAASPERTGPCPGFEVVEDGSRITAITATFSEGGCIELTGAVTQSTSWDKLLAGDLSPGGGPGCGGAIPITCEERSGNIMELPDSTFNDADWEVAFVSQTAGSTVDQQAVQQATGGVSDSSFRQMTHVIDQTTGCADERCSIVVYHRSSLTYDPGTEGAIAFIDYTETHRIIEAAFAGAAVGWTFYAEQDNTRYVASGERTAFTTTEWSTDSICGITPEDFTAEGLDFSTSGGPITFGFTRSNTNTSTINVQRNVHGIDDFKVVVVKEPPQQ